MSAEIIEILKSTVFLMPNWKWIALALGFLMGLTLRHLLEQGIRRLRSALQRDISSKSFTAYLLRLPSDSILAWIALILAWLFLVDSLKIHEGWDKYLSGLLRILLSFHIIRLSYMAVDAVGSVLVDFAATTDSTLDDRLAPFATKTLKVLVVVMGGLITLQNFDVKVMSLLAGLGLGGLALALAAQDTAANLFGSIMILLDNPFNLGDHVKISDTEGIVEEVGFRSTRIRTFTNTLVTLPNSVVAKEKIENLGIRKARRIRQILELHYETTPEKMN
jgi:MscS family membrane protein